MEQVEVIRADVSYISEIYQLEQDCFKTPWPLEVLYEDICVNHNIYFVIKENGRVVGYAGMWMILDEAHINNICIRREFRKKGYAHRLMERLIEEAYALGADSMTLVVRVSNFRAINLYKDFDFEIEGVRKGYYADNKEDAFIMWKQGIKREMEMLKMEYK